MRVEESVSSRLGRAAQVVLSACALLASPQASADPRPAILLHSPTGTHDGQVDLDYLRQLHANGFEIDYSDHHREFTWERLQEFNAIVIYGAPAEDGTKDSHIFPRSPPFQKRFGELLERYLESGGGVFVMAATFKQPGARYLAEIIEPWGVKLPLEWLKDAGTTVPMSHMPQVPLAFTDQISSSPVSAGVQGIWYPIDKDGGMTDPIWVSSDWTVVVHGTKTSYTSPVDLSGDIEGRLPKTRFVRDGGVKRPPLFAVREYGKGRIAFMAQWPQFSFSQGTQWLFHREVLEKGVAGRRSDFGRLIQNTLHWVADPSLRSRTLGGHRTDEKRFLPPNHSSKVRKDFEEPAFDEERLHRPAPGKSVYRGLIGARSAFSDGSGTIEEYARAAKAAGLDFVVFLEEFAAMTPEKLAALKSECRKHSDSKVRLFPGYVIDNNTNNHMFLHGFGIEWPPDRLLTGPRKILLNQQFQNEDGKYEIHTPLLSWLLRYQQERQRESQIGYYNFSGSDRGMRIPDLRMYSQAALRLYRGGKLIEDVTDDYLLTAQGTIPPGPISMNIVGSPEELTQAVAAGEALTYGAARALKHIYEDALRYSHSYDNINLFVSDGPIIEAWPDCYRTVNYGAEDFVAGRSWMTAPLAVRSTAGLKEIAIYDGPRLFRRFLPGGARKISLILQLAGTIHRNLVLVAEDLNGGRAVSFARRAWKEGGENLSVVFCADHVNACWGGGQLGKGPGVFQLTHPPAIWGGSTWDGGPRGSRPLIGIYGARSLQPLVDTDQGTEGVRPFNNTPLLEFADERTLKVRSVREQAYEASIPVHNAWHTYGPLDSTKLFVYTLEHTIFQRPATAVAPVGWAAAAIRRGAAVSTFAGTIRFKKALRIKNVRLLRLPWPPAGNPPVTAVVGRAQKTESYAISNRDEPLTLRVHHGGWIGFYSPVISNSLLWINRGPPLDFRVDRRDGHDRLSVWAVDLADEPVTARQTYRYELMSVHDPVDVQDRSPRRFRRTIEYFRQPHGLQLVRGRRLDSPGLLELEAEDGAVEVIVSEPPRKVGVTLPIRIRGLNPRWSAGFLQKRGANTTTYYGSGDNRYTALGFDMDGHTYCALYPDDAATTHAVLGHPVVGDEAAKDLFIQVTHLSEDPQRWHVSVNNPTYTNVKARLRQAMALPGLDFPETTLTIPAGGYRVLREQ